VNRFFVGVFLDVVPEISNCVTGLRGDRLKAVQIEEDHLILRMHKYLFSLRNSSLHLLELLLYSLDDFSHWHIFSLRRFDIFPEQHAFLIHSSIDESFLVHHSVNLTHNMRKSHTGSQPQLLQTLLIAKTDALDKLAKDETFVRVLFVVVRNVEGAARFVDEFS
jgi:hypothetical protein